MRIVSFAGIALVLLGCRQDPTLVVPPSFERPGAVAFFCYDTETRAVISLDECTDQIDFAGENGSICPRLSPTRAAVSTASPARQPPRRPRSRCWPAVKCGRRWTSLKFRRKFKNATAATASAGLC